MSGILEFWSCVRLRGCSRNSHEPIPFSLFPFPFLRCCTMTVRPEVVRERLGRASPRGVVKIGKCEGAEVERGQGVTATELG